jgi:hypothetical protein
MWMNSWMKMVAGVLLFSGMGVVQAESDRFGGADVAPVENQNYTDECGVCHFAYQPGLLPARSWRKLMDNLDDHFGESAELSDQNRQLLLDYLVNNAADNAGGHLSKMVMRYLRADETPLAISKIGFIAHDHHEIPRRVFKGDLQGLANCNACHVRAVEGSYRESEIKIPGYGRWD